VQGAVRRTGWPPVQAAQRRNAPFLYEPYGQPRQPAACGVKGGAEPSLPWNHHVVSLCLACDRLPGLRDPYIWVQPALFGPYVFTGTD
jgi:hypothetical protein